MTKLTKNEKLLREATSKWSKFLKEGAFKGQANEDALYFGDDAKDDDGNPIDLESAPAGTMWKGKPMQIDDNGQRYIVKDDGERMYATISDIYVEEEKVSEARMGEYGKIDAEDGNPPTKIGRGNEEYMAAYNAVLQARGEEPLDIQQPDQAYLDALRSGQLEEQEKEADPRVVAMQQAMDLLDDLQFDSLESALDNMNTEVVRKLGIMLKQLDYNRNQVGNIQENEKKKFEVGEFVYVVNGSLKGASGKILEPVTTSTGEEGFAIELYSDAKMKVFGKRGDEVIALPQDLESGGTSDGMELYDIDEKLSAADKEFHKSVMNKGKVPNLKGDMGPLPGLEGPFQYRSGAVLYYDPKAGAYYDRGKDMYLDREEAARLTMESNPSSFATRVTHSSDPEMDQVMDIAADMLELGARSRIPVSLKGVEMSLQKQGFDTKMEKGKLFVDDKYVIAAKDSLPDTAQKISFTKYAADYLSNIEGEQLDLPME